LDSDKGLRGNKRNKIGSVSNKYDRQLVREGLSKEVALGLRPER
jgi:hypothetical protein